MLAPKSSNLYEISKYDFSKKFKKGVRPFESCLSIFTFFVNKYSRILFWVKSLVKIELKISNGVKPLISGISEIISYSTRKSNISKLGWAQIKCRAFLRPLLPYYYWIILTLCLI